MDRDWLGFRLGKVYQNLVASVVSILMIDMLPVVPHKAVAEVSKMGNLSESLESLVVVNHGWQSESTDGLKGGWSCVILERVVSCSVMLLV